MERAGRRIWLSLVVALTVVSAGLAVVGFAFGGSFAPEAPSTVSPPFPGLAYVPGAYDAAAGYDLWFFPNGATWTYGHGAWSNITSTAGVPVNMFDNSLMTYDAKDGYVLLFGGAITNRQYQPLADTWAFVGGHWTNLTGSVVNAPPPHLLDVMAYDSEDQVVVLFGGSIPGSQILPFNDTWTYSGGTWTNVTRPGPAPPGLYRSDPFAEGFVDDPAQGYLLYYDPLGRCPAGTPPSEGSCALTWTYRGGVWTNLTSTLSSSPKLSGFDVFAYDSTARIVVVTGGCENTSTATCTRPWGTFVFTGTGWKDRTPALNPALRDFANAVDDPSDGGVMLVGGCCWADFSGLSLRWDDVWVYAQGNWTEHDPWAGAPPSWAEDDGAPLGVGIAAVSAVVIVYTVRRGPVRRP